MGKMSGKVIKIDGSLSSIIEQLLRESHINCVFAMPLSWC
jgi:hypothetical protein